MKQHLRAKRIKKKKPWDFWVADAYGGTKLDLNYWEQDNTKTSIRLKIVAIISIILIFSMWLLFLIFLRK